MIESTQGNLKFTTPLTGITAAVVGVIFNLGLFFTYHVVWPLGLEADLDWFSTFLAIAGLIGLIGLIGYRAGIIPLILVSDLVGLIHRMLA